MACNPLERNIVPAKRRFFNSTDGQTASIRAQVWSCLTAYISLSASAHRAYFLTRLVWLATQSHLVSWRTQVSVKRPKCSYGLPAYSPLVW